jgi:hypothetical protein
MDEKNAKYIISKSMEAINVILIESGYMALARSKSKPPIAQRRRVISTLTFLNIPTERRLLTFYFILITDRHNQVKVKTITKSIQYEPATLLTIREMYANPDFSVFLPPFRKVTTIESVSVDAIVADFFTSVDEYCKYAGYSISSQHTVRYFEVLMKQHRTKLKKVCNN